MVDRRSPGPAATDRRSGPASATVTDQDSFVFTATAPCARLSSSLRSSSRVPELAVLVTCCRQQVIPAAPSRGLTPSRDAATLAGAGSISTGRGSGRRATLAGTGSIAASRAAGTSPGSAGGAERTGTFADRRRHPRSLWGGAARALPGNVGRWSSGAWQADYDTYFATRQAQGVTDVLYTKPMEHHPVREHRRRGRHVRRAVPVPGRLPVDRARRAQPLVRAGLERTGRGSTTCSTSAAGQGHHRLPQRHRLQQRLRQRARPDGGQVHHRVPGVRGRDRREVRRPSRTSSGTWLTTTSATTTR